MNYLAPILVVLVAWPWSDPEPRPPSPLPGENGMETSFGRIDSVWHETFRFHPVDWESRVVIKPEAGAAAEKFLFALVAESATSRVTLTSLTKADGSAVPVYSDERGRDPLVPKVFVNASDVPVGEELILRGTVELTNNGRYQVGSLVVAFDRDWKKVMTPDGVVAQLYAYGFVGASGLDTRAGAPPLEGAGNVGPWAVLVVVAMCVGGGLAGLLYFLRGRR